MRLDLNQLTVNKVRFHSLFELPPAVENGVTNSKPMNRPKPMNTSKTRLAVTDGGAVVRKLCTSRVGGKTGVARRKLDVTNFQSENIFIIHTVDIRCQGHNITHKNYAQCVHMTGPEAVDPPQSEANS